MSLLESPGCLGCQAGFSFLYVTAQGEVFPCDFVPLSVGNVFQLGVPEVCRRLVELLTAPSQACLALRLRERCQEQTTWPLTWEQGRVILRDYDPGPLPGLLRSLCRDR
jgi:radical SAM protein with 4Fe4S-binding SPASM domain